MFTSLRERNLWLLALVVLITITSTLFIGQPLADIFLDQNLQAAIFLLGMVMISGVILIHAIKIKPRKTELAVWLGVAAVYIIFFLRLGLPERSHLMEYSVLAILIHMALVERSSMGKKIRGTALIALAISFLIGVLDESIQLFIPERVFDLNDIIFNGFIVTIAIGTNMALKWVRRRFRKERNN